MKIGDEIVTKSGRLFPDIVSPEILTGSNPYVSRGGLKLAHALKEFTFSVQGKTVLDIGASTGGFTDCLLQHGAQKIFAVDVGYGQMDWKLQNDFRVAILDRQNARHLKPEMLGTLVDLAVIDVSFISLKLIIPAAIQMIKPPGDIVALVKPQFEVGKGEVENKGVIKDPKKHLKVLLDLRDFMESQGWVICQLAASPITGQKGNREFLIHCTPNSTGNRIDEEVIEQVAFNK